MHTETLSKFNLLIRPHPTKNSKLFKKKFNNLNIKNAKIDYNENFFFSLMRSKFFFGGMSSTCLEAIMLNVPAIVYKNSDYLASSCVPEFISNKCYLYSNDYKKIQKFILRDKYQTKILSNKIRNNCFKIISNNLMNEFNL